MTQTSGSTSNFGPQTTVADIGEQQLISLIVDRLRQVTNEVAVMAAVAAAADSDAQPLAAEELGNSNNLSSNQLAYKSAVVEVAAGDDAAVLQLPSDRVVISTDVLVEERHFRTRWSTGIDIGVKVAAANLADIAAMGARPAALVVALVIPGTTHVQWVQDLATGLAQEASRIGAKVVGGDISDGEQISIAATAIGSLEPGVAALQLTGAKVGDQVAILGRLGWSAAGLAILSRGFSSPRVVVDSHRQPNPRYQEAISANLAGATTMTDVSDGLVAELANIARSSQVALEIDYDSLPVAEELRQASAALNVAVSDWVLGGGEDHAFVATFPADNPLPAGFISIGRVVDRVPGAPIVQVLDSESVPMDLRSYRGYVHY